MKKKIFSVVAAVAVVAAAGWSYQQSKQYNRIITDEIQSVEFLPHGVKTTYRRYCSWGGFQDCTSGIWTLVTPRY